ncbi:hypothetical protein BKA93DRAFT_31557 [Sparassis latifolia]
MDALATPKKEGRSGIDSAPDEMDTRPRKGGRAHPNHKARSSRLAGPMGRLGTGTMGF